MPEGIFKFQYTTKSGHSLTDAQTIFCYSMYRTRGDRVLSACEAFDIDVDKKNWKTTAAVMASRALALPQVSEALGELFADLVLTQEEVDRELAYVIRQKTDLNPKVKAINEYNKITGRHSATRFLHQFTGVNQKELEESLAREIAEIIALDSRNKGKEKR